MGGGSRCRHIGRAAFARLVGKESALHSVHDGCSDAAACRLMNAEGVCQDCLEDMRNEFDVHHNDDDGQHQIADSHNGHQDGTDMGYALDAAEDDEQGQERQYASHPYGRQAEGLLHGSTDGVGLDRVVGETELAGDEYGKRNGHPPLVQSALDIVGWSANERVFVLLFEQLRQC